MLGLPESAKAAETSKSRDNNKKINIGGRKCIIGQMSSAI